MCRKFVIVSEFEKIERRFNVSLSPNIEPLAKHYAVSSGDKCYVITCEDPKLLQEFTFGMTPFYASDPMNLITARAEGDKNGNNDPNYNGSRSIFLKTPFKKPIYSQRCLVIADAWYEWTPRKKPFLFHLINKNRPFAFAGIYDYWKNPDTNEITTSFSIITTVANPLIQSIGIKRLPVILSKIHEQAWIKSSNHLSDVLVLLNPYPAEEISCYPVSDRVNSPGANDPSLLNPFEEKPPINSNTTFVLRSHRQPKQKGDPDRLCVEV